MNDDNKDCKPQGIYWWAMLVVAVLAIPAIGGIVALSGAGSKGVFPLGIFISACWICTYLGMKLMHNPKASEKPDRKKKP